MDCRIERSNVISDAVLTHNGAQGVFMRSARRNQFLGIVIRDSGRQGVFIAQVEGKPETSASHNVFTGLTIENSAGASVRINDASCADNVFRARRSSQTKAAAFQKPRPA